MCILCTKTKGFDFVSQELQLPMLKVSAPELVSGVSGESEQKLRELFDLAVVSSSFLLLIHCNCCYGYTMCNINFHYFFFPLQSSAPCILFIDEIDAITPKREVASKDMERRIVAQLLTCMDGMVHCLQSDM